jgi:hypothetical protein
MSSNEIQQSIEFVDHCTSLLDETTSQKKQALARRFMQGYLRRVMRQSQTNSIYHVSNVLFRHHLQRVLFHYLKKEFPVRFFTMTNTIKYLKTDTASEALFFHAEIRGLPSPNSSEISPIIPEHQ